MEDREDPREVSAKMSKFNLDLLDDEPQVEEIKEPKPKRETTKPKIQREPKEPKSESKTREKKEVLSIPVISMEEFNQIKNEMRVYNARIEALNNQVQILQSRAEHSPTFNEDEPDVALEAIVNFVLNFYDRWFSRGKAVAMKILVERVIEKYNVRIRNMGDFTI